MIECIQSSGWTGYMLMKVRHDLLEVGFVKVPGDDEGSVRMFVVISHLCFFRPWLFCPSVKRKSYQTALQRCPGPSA